MNRPGQSPRWRRLGGRTALLLAALAGTARAAELTVTLPQGTTVTAAEAVAPGAAKLNVSGRVEGQKVHFDGLVPDAAYDIRLSLGDGRALWGVNLGWYSIEEADASAGPLSEDDRREIQDICNVPSFYDKSQVLWYSGNHDRATCLMRLLRDRDFHAGRDAVIWRAEVWFFKFQNGGWEKVNQQTRLMERKRFASPAEYAKTVQPICFVPRLGGITPQAKDQKLTVELTASDLRDAIPAIPDAQETKAPAAEGEKTP